MKAAVLALLLLAAPRAAHGWDFSAYVGQGAKDLGFTDSKGAAGKAALLYYNWRVSGPFVARAFAGAATAKNLNSGGGLFPVVGFQPGIRAEGDWAFAALYPLGIAYYPDPRSGSDWQLTFAAVIGWKAKNGIEIAFQWQHFSNGDLAAPNNGVDLLGILVGL